MNTLHPFCLPTHLRFHHHNYCLSFHSILHSGKFEPWLNRNLPSPCHHPSSWTWLRRTCTQPWWLDSRLIYGHMLQLSLLLCLVHLLHSIVSSLLFSHTSSSLWNFKHLLSFMFNCWLCFICHWENRSHQEEISLFFLCQIEDPPVSEPLNPHTLPGLQWLTSVSS